MQDLLIESIFLQHIQQSQVCMRIRHTPPSDHTGLLKRVRSGVKPPLPLRPPHTEDQGLKRKVNLAADVHVLDLLGTEVGEECAAGDQTYLLERNRLESW